MGMDEKALYIADRVNRQAMVIIVASKDGATNSVPSTSAEHDAYHNFMSSSIPRASSIRDEVLDLESEGETTLPQPKVTSRFEVTVTHKGRRKFKGI